MSEQPEVEYPDVEVQNSGEDRELPDPDSQDWKPDLNEPEVPSE